MKKKRILLAYAVPRSGHAQAAHALLEEFNKNEGFEAKEFNLLEWHPTFVKLFPFLYRWMIRHSPSTWRHFHGNTSYAPLMNMLRTIAVRTGLFGFERACRAYAPDAIIATHFLHTQILGEARLQKRIGVPVYSAPTDYGAHPFWAHPGIDHYFVASANVRADLLREGIAEDRIDVTGIPVKQEILDRPTRADAVKELGLDPKKKNILIMGGSYGFFPFDEFIREILAGPERNAYTWMILFGSDRKAFDAATPRVPDAEKKTVRLFSYLPRIAPIFSAAHVAIAKPGGIFTAESLACGMPIVIHRPLPGQEDMNAAYLVGNSAAERAASPREAIRLADGMLSDDRVYGGYVRAVRKIARPNAANDVVSLVRRLMASDNI